jgi:hypothetical protein
VRVLPAYAAPSAFALGLLVLGWAAEAGSQSLRWSLVGAAVLLVVWNAALVVWARRARRSLHLEIAVRKQHYLQACAQATVLLYWGWYWRQVYDSAHLILAQLLFAYAFDMLLSWSRRDVYTFGFGPFPIIFSINLFLWFKPDWFYFQLAMVAVGFAAKELIRWNKDGRYVHIFNPSSFTLAIFSLALILTGRSELTWGREIATTQFYPPHMYLVLFLVGLPGQFFFGVTTMTLSAVVTTYLFGLTYYALTGIYFFYDSYIPIAVFLGMHLLFTDPSTSPRTGIGRVIFGALYGLSTVALYQFLGTMGLPTFYDKLLQVPVLNLSIQLIDRLVRRAGPALRLSARRAGPVYPERSRGALWTRLAWRVYKTRPALPTVSPWRRHLAYIGVWTVVFTGMSAAQGVGDEHPGQWLPFWQQACEDERPHACRYLAGMHAGFCSRGSTWSCNELDILQGRDARSTPPTLEDFPIILRGSKGPISERDPAELYALACRQGWRSACRPEIAERTEQRYSPQSQQR